MANDEPTNKSSSTPLPGASDSERIVILERQLKQQMELLDRLAENVERVWDRSAWRIKLEASRSEHVLGLAAEVAKDHQSRDRNTESVLSLMRKISEQDDDIGHIKGGVDTLVLALNTKQVVQDALDAAAAREANAAKEAAAKDAATKETVTAVVEDAVDRITKSHRLPTRKEIEDEAEDENRRVNVFARIYITFAKADIVTRVLTFFMVLFALAGFLGWIFYKLNANAEAPQGRSFEEWREHHPAATVPQPSPK